MNILSYATFEKNSTGAGYSSATYSDMDSATYSSATRTVLYL